MTLPSGFLRCLTELLEIDLPIPDHTTLSRRLKTLSDIQLSRLRTDRPIHLLIDSSGLRIHVGHMQKPPRNKAWRKLHLAVAAASGEIVASDLTTRRTHDCTQVPALLEQTADPIASVSADGAYDTKAVYEAAHERGERRAVRVGHRFSVPRIFQPDSQGSPRLPGRPLRPCRSRPPRRSPFGSPLAPPGVLLSELLSP